MRYDRDLIDELSNIAILYHASRMLPYKLLEVLDKHIPHIGDVCKERGCVEYMGESSFSINPVCDQSAVSTPPGE